MEQKSLLEALLGAKRIRIVAKCREYIYSIEYSKALALLNYWKLKLASK